MKKCGWLFVLFLVCFIFYNSSLTGTESGGLSGPLAQWVASFFHLPATWDVELILRKGAHFCEYALLGISVAAAQKLFPLNFFKDKKRLFLFLTVPIIDETIQYFTPGRSCEIKDMAIDACGYIFGLILAILLIKLFIKKEGF